MLRNFCFKSTRILALLTFVFGIASSAFAEQGNKIALLVGCNKYDKRGLADAPLMYAERDVTELAKVLKDAGFDVRLLTSSGTNKPNKAGIEAAIKTVL